MTNVVLIHGYLESPQMWDFISSGLESSALRLTQPGHGPEALPSVKDMSELAHEAWKRIDASGISAKVHFIGHSMGGYLALACARLRPEAVGSLCLFHSTCRADSQEKKARRDKAISMLETSPRVYLRATISGLYANEKRSASTVERQISHAENLSAADFQTCLQIMKSRDDSVDFLLNRKFALGYITGTEDPLLPLVDIESEFSEVRGDYFRAISHAGHMSHCENQTEAEEALHTWKEQFMC